MRKYPKEGSLQEYREDVRDRIHNSLKHGMVSEKYVPYYRSWYKSKWSKRLVLAER